MAKYKLAFHFDNETAVCETDISGAEVISMQMMNKQFIVIQDGNGNNVYFRYGHINYIEEQKIEDRSD